jgi:hypothetical protein
VSGELWEKLCLLVYHPGYCNSESFLKMSWMTNDRSYYFYRKYKSENRANINPKIKETWDQISIFGDRSHPAWIPIEDRVDGVIHSQNPWATNNLTIDINTSDNIWPYT